MSDAVTQHAALLALVDEYIASADADDYPVRFPLEALRRVLEVHKPAPLLVSVTDPDGPLVALCHGCSHHRWAQPIIAVGWFDCLTIAKVAEALGVDLNG